MATKKQKKDFPTENLTNGEVIDRYQMLSMPVDLHGFDVCYPKDRNLEKLRLAIKYNKLERDVKFPKTDAYKAYEKELSDLFKQLSENPDGSNRLKVVRDARGNEQEVYDVDVTSEEYLTAKALLNQKHDAALQDRQEQLKKYDEFLDEPFAGEIKLYYVSAETVKQTNPNISNRTMTAISWMILPDD